MTRFVISIALMAVLVLSVPGIFILMNDLKDKLQAFGGLVARVSLHDV